ncbi:MAG: DUF3089 domain-containing protein [Burkholderiales bacterium]|nr:DUF3089 domain-containing protein [Burkholderiales bacterium]
MHFDVKTLRATVLAALATVALPSPALAQPAANPWASPEAWLCQPGRQDLCSTPVARSIVAAEGSAQRDESRAQPAAPIDCFYVYPTISTDPNGNSSLAIGPGEQRAVAHQFALFASVCRPFAPMYRQVTLAGLRSLIVGQPIPMDRELGYRDVLAAWQHYLATENQGRGVVLIGHSQGARMLMQLLQQEIDGKPVQARLVSAVLAGMNIEVPPGQDKGGSFQHLPLCRSAGQAGCVIAYASYRASLPPPANALFGRSRSAGREVACVDPVALSGQPVDSYLPVPGNLLGGAPRQDDWLAMAKTVDTPFVTLPGLLSARCVNEGGASYLSFTLTPAAQGPQPKDIPGDTISQGRVLDNWGLHLVDIGLVAGNLRTVVRRQGQAWLAAQPTPAAR